MIGKSSSGCLIPIILLFIVTVFGNGWTQEKILTYNQAFENSEPYIFKDLPDVQSWLDDEHYLSWKSSDDFKKSQLIKTHALTGESEIFIDFENLNKKFFKGTIKTPWVARTKDYMKYIIESDGDLYLYIPVTELLKQLTQTKEEEKNPRFSPDGKKVAFTRGHDLFMIEFETGQELRLTNDGSHIIYNGWASWVYYEEILGRKSKYAAFWWAPNSQMIAFMRFDDSKVPEYPIFHCEGPDSYLEMQRYPQPGDSNPSVKLGIFNLSTNDIVWMDTNPTADDYVAWPFWTPDSKSLFFQWMNRGQDNLQIRRADPLSGMNYIVYEETQASWVEFFEDLYILNGDAGILIRSDRDGWRHLYHYSLEGILLAKITEGEWDVDDIVMVDEKNRIVYFHGSKEDKTDKHLYKIRMDGEGLEKLTVEPGIHNTKISKEGTYFIDTYSSINQPGISNLYLSNGQLVKNLGDKWKASTEDYCWGKTELFSIASEDGINLPAIWVLPPNFDKSKKYPVIFNVYGGPGRASVVNRYPSLPDHYYAQHGIIVMSVDHRGSKHFGKKGTEKMYRSLGKWEMYDLISAVKWLQQLPYIDADRIGIVGGSYGGYVACMALTYGADYFTHGIARYSVTDWRFYDSVYTERYMDQPWENPDGYEFGSVMTYTDRFKGKLLITHGALDDNVHMQNTIEFVQDLQKSSKDFNMMIYPNQRHGIKGKWRYHANKEEVAFWFRHFLNKDLIL